MMRLKAIVALSFLAMLVGSRASAAERTLTINVDGRPASHDVTMAKMRGNVAYAEIVILTRIFGGLVSIRKTGVTTTVGAHVARFHANDAKATVDGVVMTMPAATFTEDGDLYVPLAFFAKNVVPGTTVRIDRANGRATLHLKPQTLPTADAPSASPSP